MRINDPHDAAGDEALYKELVDRTAMHEVIPRQSPEGRRLHEAADRHAARRSGKTPSAPLAESVDRSAPGPAALANPVAATFAKAYQEQRDAQMVANNPELFQKAVADLKRLRERREGKTTSSPKTGTEALTERLVKAIDTEAFSRKILEKLEAIGAIRSVPKKGALAKDVPAVRVTAEAGSSEHVTIEPTGRITIRTL